MDFFHLNNEGNSFGSVSGLHEGRKARAVEAGRTACRAKFRPDVSRLALGRASCIRLHWTCRRSQRTCGVDLDLL